LDFWAPRSGQERGVRLHYWLWMQEAYKQAAILHSRVQFQLVHHVSFSTVAVPPPFWKLPVPAVWGPVGGGQSFPKTFSSHLCGKRAKEVLRSLNLLLLPFSPALRRGLASTRLVLATNLETKNLLKRAGATRVDMFLDCGVDARVGPPSRRVSEPGLTLLWAGRFEPQKGLSIALRALAVCKHSEICLLVAGSGSEQAQMESLARSLGLAHRVQFLGQVPRENMEALFRNSDALVFTSLRDSFGSVVLEAMSRGVPVIALNHQGIRAFVPDDACIKVPVNFPQQVINDLADAFDVLWSNPELAQAISRAALAFAEKQTWERRTDSMNELYAETISGAGGNVFQTERSA
jgi:glycosyltransferase involved in cell wall biosynthesis